MMLNKRGAMLIEYALIFVVLLGAAMAFGSFDFTQLVTNPFNQASSALDGKSKINNSDSFWKAINRDNTLIVYDGKEYANASTPINEMLTQNNYSGHENITWSVIGTNLYVYDERKLTTADAGKTFKVARYDLTSKDPEPTSVNVRFVKSSKGNYAFLTP